MLTIDEAISRELKRADFNRSLYGISILKEKNEHLLRDAEEHEQIAEWLKDYKEMKGM